MRGIIYRLSISESFFHANHGEFQSIDELYIPDLKFAVNKKWMGLVTDAGRYDNGKSTGSKVLRRHAPVKIRDVEIPEEMIMQIKTFIRMREELDLIEDDIRKQAKSK